MEKLKSEFDRKRLHLAMLEYIDKLFTKEGIWYSLAYGTLLGAVREKGFIPWDRDADIYVRYCDLSKIRKIINEDKNCPYHLCIPGVEKNYSSCHDRLTMPGISHYDFHLDLYGLIGLPSDTAKARKYVDIGYKAYVFFAAKYKPLSKTKHKFALALLKPLSNLIPDAFPFYIYNKIAVKYPYESSKYVSILGAAYKDYYLKSDLEEVCYLEFEDIKLACLASYDKYLTSIYGDYMVPRQKNYVFTGSKDI